MTATVLSPFAQPFHPAMGEEMNPTIFNDGVPTLTFQGSDTEFLHTIDDDTLDDAFPPTAEEAAELEAVEVFVDLMMNLAILEEQEEAARSLRSGLKKRWEARRGLHGRPRVAKHLVNQVIHGDPHSLESRELVVYDPSPTLTEHRMRVRENDRVSNPRTSKKLLKKGKPQKPIQQPRKHC